MRRFEIRPEWALKDSDGSEHRLRTLFDLLSAIAAEGNLNKACAQLGVSYRHAWGLVRRGAALVGAPLVNSGRGQRAQLTALGEKLVWANKRIAERLTPILESFSSELESELKQAVQDSKAIVRIHASHAFAISALHALLQEKHKPLDLRYVGNGDALAALSRGACDMAGFHVPLGALENEVMETYARWLDPGRHVLIHLVVRHQGLIVARGNPAGISSMADLAKPGVRFVNRQPGSGTRLLFGMLLKQAGMNGAQISGFDTAEYTHGAIAAYIASGMADAGPGVETAARQFNLGFVPLVNERYFLVCDQDTLGTAPAKNLLAVISGAEFRYRLSEIPGIDCLQCGAVQSVTEAFADRVFPKARATR